METIRLRDNVATMPRIGIGTYRTGGHELVRSVRAALDARPEGLLVDTARAYRNEGAVAEAVQGYSNAFVITKVSPRSMGSYEDVRKSVMDSLSDLKRRQIDLVLLHWPGAAKLPPDSSMHPRKRIDAWRALEDLHREGFARSIGVSNFTERHLRGLKHTWAIPPHVNQVEMHPAWPQEELMHFCDAHGINVMAYSPLGSGNLLEEEVVKRTSERIQRTPAQLLLRWCLQKGASCVVKSSNPERLVQNLRVHDFELEDSDMKELDVLSVKRRKKYCWDPQDIL